MSIEVRNISKRFNQHVALDDISLEFPEGELVALLGPSGCGKTTLLRIIAGLEATDAGRVLFAGEDAGDRNVRERQVGFVFQHYALFRHMTVFENIAFGLRVKPRGERPGEAQIRHRVKELLDLVQLDWLADRYPAQLSGGQRQRIALARALAVEPRVLLLDEPFGALDAKVRKDLRRWLRRLHDEMGLTSIFVTHDQEEALEVADRIVVMNHGKVEQQGSPETVYDHPASPFVFEFLGNVNLFHGRPGQRSSGSGEVAYVRPHEVEIQPWSDMPGERFEARLLHARLAGPSARLKLELVASGETLEAEITKDRYRDLALSPGSRVAIGLPKLRVYPAAGVGIMQG
jgi:sulfate/thiosulfate transport system ATP-binding protein